MREEWLAVGSAKAWRRGGHRVVLAWSVEWGGFVVASVGDVGKSVVVVGTNVGKVVGVDVGIVVGKWNVWNRDDLGILDFLDFLEFGVVGGCGCS